MLAAPGGFVLAAPGDFGLAAPGGFVLAPGGFGLAAPGGFGLGAPPALGAKMAIKFGPSILGRGTVSVWTPSGSLHPVRSRSGAQRIQRGEATVVPHARSRTWIVANVGIWTLVSGFCACHANPAPGGILKVTRRS